MADINELSEIFDRILLQLPQLAAKAREQHPPTMRLVNRWKVDQLQPSETGAAPALKRLEYLTREEWWKATSSICDDLQKTAEYSDFKQQVMNHVVQYGAVPPAFDSTARQFDAMFATIAHKAIAQEPLECRTLLTVMLAQLSGAALPVWVEAEGYGLSLKTKSIRLELNGIIFTFRQLETGDFEKEFSPARPMMNSNHALPPTVMVKVEMRTKQRDALQTELARAATLIRLFSVCSFDYGVQNFGVDDPYSLVAGIGGFSFSVGREPPHRLPE